MRKKIKRLFGKATRWNRRPRTKRKPHIEPLRKRQLLAADINIGAVRPGGGDLLQQLLDTEPLQGSRDTNAEIQFDYGLNSTAPAAGTTGDDIALAGDFSGVGFDQVVVTRGLPGGALQWLGDTDRDTDEEYLFRFGLNTFTPLIADMNGDGIDDAVAVDTSTTSNLLEWYVHYGVPGANPFPTNDSTVSTDATFSFGVDADHPAAGGGVADIPMVGDIDNDGDADVLVYRENGASFDVYVDNHVGALPNNTSTVLGSGAAIGTNFQIGYVPVVGDWDNDGDDNFGAIDEGTSPSTWRLDTSGDGVDDFTLQYGLAGDQYIVGAWPDILWDGSDNQTWGDPDNWSGGQTPQSSQDVVIDQPASAAAINVAGGNNSAGTLSSRENIDVTAGTLTVSGTTTSSGSVSISGGTLRLDGTMSASSLTLSSGTLAIGADEVVGSTPFSASGGTISAESPGGKDAFQ